MEITLRKGKLPIIKTKRLVMREIRIEDISQAYIDWLNNPQITRFLEIRFHPQPLEEVKRFVQSKLDDVHTTMHFGVYDQDGSRLVGNVTLPKIDVNHWSSDISYIIGHHEAMGKKYAVEAVHGVVYYAFNFTKIEKLWAGIYEGHVASEMVLLKNGFTIEGNISRKYIHPDGKHRVGHVLFGLFKDEFRPNAEILGGLPPVLVENNDL